MKQYFFVAASLLRHTVCAPLAHSDPVTVALYRKGKAVLRKAYFKIGRAKPQQLRDIRTGCFFAAIANLFYITVVGCFDVGKIILRLTRRL